MRRGVYLFFMTARACRWIKQGNRSLILTFSFGTWLTREGHFIHTHCSCFPHASTDIDQIISRTESSVTSGQRKNGAVCQLEHTRTSTHSLTQDITLAVFRPALWNSPVLIYLMPSVSCFMSCRERDPLINNNQLSEAFIRTTTGCCGYLPCRANFWLKRGRVTPRWWIPVDGSDGFLVFK